MSAELFDLAMRMRAHEERRAVFARATSPVKIRDDAMVIAVVGMPGEHAGMWAVSAEKLSDLRARLARRRPARKPIVVADARERAQQIELWKQLGAVINPWAARCEERGESPQIVVANRVVLELLEASAEWVATVAVDEDGDRQVATARSAAETMMFIAERSAYTGNQTAVPVAELLGSMIMTGADTNADKSLAVLLSWISPPNEGPLQRLTSVADREDCFVPESDDEGIAEQVSSYMKKRNRSTGEDRGIVIDNTVQGLRPVMLKLLNERFARINEAVAAYQSFGLPELSLIEATAGDDNYTWVSHRKWVASRDHRKWLSTRDFPGRAALKLMTRETAAERWVSAEIWEDSILRARAEAAGEVVSGMASPGPEPGQFTVVTDHPSPRLRSGDTVAELADPKTSYQVIHSERWGPQTHIVLSGGTLAGAVVLCPEPESLGRIRARLMAARNKSFSVAWTHSNPAKTPAPARPVADPEPDLLSRVERMRATRPTVGA